MRLRITLLFALALLPVPAVKAGEPMPKRKPGLWEIHSQMQGMHMPGGGVQMCVDEKSDNILQQRANEAKPDCRKMDWTQEAGKISVSSVCKIDATITATTTGTFSGDFTSAYRGELHMAYAPPMHGMKEMDMVISAKWLGPCKAGQKGGDVVMPGMGGMGMPGGMKGFNMNDMMKMQEKMQGQMKKKRGQ